MTDGLLAEPLPPADVIIMGHILHDWDLDQKRMLLDKAYTALPKGGALIVYEAIIDEAHKQGLRVMAHVFYLEDAKDLVRAGVDGFAHLVLELTKDLDRLGLVLPRFVRATRMQHDHRSRR